MSKVTFATIVLAELRISNDLLNHRNTLTGDIDSMKSTVDDLDELGDIMSDMLSAQEDIQVCPVLVPCQPT